jgi:hypothetical protein
VAHIGGDLREPLPAGGNQRIGGALCSFMLQYLHGFLN